MKFEARISSFKMIGMKTSKERIGTDVSDRCSMETCIKRPLRSKHTDMHRRSHRFDIIWSTHHPGLFEGCPFLPEQHRDRTWLSHPVTPHFPPRTRHRNNTTVFHPFKGQRGHHKFYGTGITAANRSCHQRGNICMGCHMLSHSLPIKMMPQSPLLKKYHITAGTSWSLLIFNTGQQLILG